MSVLSSIIEGVREDLATRRLPMGQLQEALETAPAVRDCLLHLLSIEMSVIAEVKRSSPSKGALATITDPASLAAQYEEAGAQIVSVLTEQRRFGGSLADLDAVRKAIELPILRKDFMVDEYQVWEARAHGADLILLIVAGLSDNQLAELNGLAHQLGMSVLVEIHDESELDRALAINPKLLGVNARNLKTLEVSLDVCHTLIPQIPDQILAIAESGISSTDQVEALVLSGARAVLVGEALVTGGTPAKTVAEWTQAGIRARENFLLNRS